MLSLLFFWLTVWSKSYEAKKFSLVLFFTNFLLAATALYALLYSFSPIIITAILIILNAFSLFCFYELKGNLVRLYLAYTLIFTQAVLIFSLIDIGILLKAALATLFLALLLETKKNPYFNRWKVQEYYAILILLFSLTLGLSLYLIGPQ